MKIRRTGSHSLDKLVCRLVLRDGSAVIGKLSSHHKATLEARIYRELLAPSNISELNAVQFFGLVNDFDPIRGWIFLGDTGGEPFSPADPGDRLLASRWIGTLHRGLGRGMRPPSDLRDGGLDRSAERILRSLDRLLELSRLQDLTVEDRGFLGRLQRDLDSVRASWPALEKAAGAIPHTLVHGDFVAKNMRVIAREGTRTLAVFDWSSAGWGSPVADLVNLDLDQYLIGLGDMAGTMGQEELRVAQEAGKVLRYISAIHWTLPSLRFPDRRKPMTNLVQFQAGLRRALSVVVTAVHEGPARAPGAPQNR